MTDQQAQSRRTTSRFLLGMVVVAFVIVSLMLVMHWYSRERLYVSSSAIRHGITDTRRRPDAGFGSIPSRIPYEKSKLFKLQKKMDQENLLLGPESYTGKSPISIIGDQWTELSFGGRIRLDRVVITSGKPNKDRMQKARTYIVPYQQGKQSVESLVNYERGFPYCFISCYFKFDQIAENKLRHIDLVDLQTNWVIGRSSFLFMRNNKEVYDNGVLCDIPVQWNNPTELSFDLHYGERQVTEISFQSPEIVSIQGVRIGMLYYSEGTNGYIGNGTTVDIRKSRKSPVYFDQIQVKTKQGVVDASFQREYGQGVLCGFLAEVDDIESLLLYWYPYKDRITYTIDRFPDIYADQAPFKNLADVPMDFICFTNETQMEHWLSEALQLRFSVPPQPTSFPPGYFPVVFEGKTVKEIFDAYLKHLPNHGEIEIDEESGWLTIRKKEKQGWTESVFEKMF